jgi:hypothetical protein
VELWWVIISMWNAYIAKRNDGNIHGGYNVVTFPPGGTS